MKILLLSLFISTSVFAQKNAPAVRWKKLMNLVQKEMKILENAKRKGPELQYRMLELHSEKLKLLHEKNNNEFMEKSKTANVTANKESYFAETRKYYQMTKDFGLKILKEYPQSPRRGEILFAMALNSRDYGKDNITEQYLLDALSMVRDPHHALKHHAETALADFYYNEKKYPEAISYYERAIKKIEDEWLPKHYFNLGWCYLKERQFDKSISAMKKAYARSKHPNYVNIQDQILNGIGSFYIHAGRPLDGLAFYVKNVKDPVPYLITMSVKTSEKGHEKESEIILNKAQEIVDKKKFYQYQEELFHAYLDFYNQFKRYSDHEKVSSKLVAYYKRAASQPKLKLKQDMREDTVEKLRTVAGFLQVKLSRDMKEDESLFKESELKIVLSYFGHLITLDPKRKSEYLYFKGETFYSVRKYKEAAPAYVQSTLVAKKAKDQVNARKALNSLLALTSHETLDKNLNLKYLIFAYSQHISIWPRDEKSEKIYPKLFEIYKEKGADPKAAGVLSRYNKAYPEHLATQQQLMTKILDVFIEKKNTAKLAYWIGRFKDGFLSFPKATIEKTEIVLGNILFLQYQEMAKKGQKIEAAKGFESIHANKLYSSKVKSQAAFFAALTHLELGDTIKSYYWQTEAYKLFTEEEKLAKRDEQLKIAERTYKLQDFTTSYKLSEFLLKKFCSKKDKIQDRLFEVAVMTSLVEEKALQAELIITHHSDCLGRREIHNEALSQIYQLHEKKASFLGLQKFVRNHPTEDFKNRYRLTLQKWYWEKNSVQMRDLINKEFKLLNHPESNQWMKEVSQLADAKKNFEGLKKFVIWNKPKFDGDAFNKSLEGYLLQIQNFKQQNQNLTQSTQVDLAILSTRLFADLYLDMGQKIQGLKPAGMDAQTMKDFSGAMNQLGGQFLTVSKDFESQLDKALKEKETLAWGTRSIASTEDVENPVFSFFTGLTMDKSRE